MKKLFVPILLALLLSACASSNGHTARQNQLHGPTYGVQEARQAKNVIYATVVDIKPVVIQSPVQTSTVGTIASAGTGGLIGGALGSKVGKGSGKKVATVLGSVIGASAGMSIQQSMAEANSKKQGIEIVVRFADGSNRIQSIMQEINGAESFGIGQTVRLSQQQWGWHVSPI